MGYVESPTLTVRPFGGGLTFRGGKSSSSSGGGVGVGGGGGGGRGGGGTNSGGGAGTDGGGGGGTMVAVMSRASRTMSAASRIMRSGDGSASRPCRLPASTSSPGHRIGGVQTSLPPPAFRPPPPPDPPPPPPPDPCAWSSLPTPPLPSSVWFESDAARAADALVRLDP